MANLIDFVVQDSQCVDLSEYWKSFLTKNYHADQKIKIIFDSPCPTIIDSENRKLRIDFQNDSENYKKKKLSISSEPLSRALGSGAKGLRILDLSAGMGIDAIFLVQLGYQVTAIERNPLLFLTLQNAQQKWNDEYKKNINFVFSESQAYLNSTVENFDVCYFDPMFPQKKKSALPKQEMVLFKNLIGADEDASNVLKLALDSKKFKRCVVKRPVSAESLLSPSGAIKGKIIRYDIYGGID